MTPMLLALAGVALLVVGGELLVRGAVHAARQFGVSELLIGLTLVGFATSCPELITSIEASMQGASGIAIGNFVGSNISNILLILGLSAVLYPIKVDSRCLRRDGYFVAATAIAFATTSLLLPYNRLLGLAFVTTLLVYIAYAVYEETTQGRRDHTSAFQKSEAFKQIRLQSTAATPADTSNENTEIIPRVGLNWLSISANIGIAVVGFVILALGGRLLVDGASDIARSSGVPEETIGLTIVAIGTSLPEFVTSLVAASRGYSSIALGNILGSNIYNTLGIGGVTALLAPTQIPPQIIYYDNLVMVAACLLFVLFATLDFRIRRWEGLALVFAYVVYLISLLPVSKANWAIDKGSSLL